MAESIVKKKAFEFALLAIDVYKLLLKEKEFVFFKAIHQVRYFNRSKY